MILDAPSDKAALFESWATAKGAWAKVRTGSESPRRREAAALLVMAATATVATLASAAGIEAARIKAGRRAARVETGWAARIEAAIGG